MFDIFAYRWARHVRFLQSYDISQRPHLRCHPPSIAIASIMFGCSEFVISYEILIRMHEDATYPTNWRMYS